MIYGTRSIDSPKAEPMESPAPLATGLTSAAAAEHLTELAVATAEVANFCDHVEHCEAVSRDWVTDAGKTLRTLAVCMAADASLDVFELYAHRLDGVERRHPLFPVQGYHGREHALEARSWNELQAVQYRHDQLYHPDVLGLQKLDQLRHYALHMSKLTGALGAAIRDDAAAEDFSRRRLPDLLLFGLKLATVMGQRLPDEQLPRAT
jgi:hypothetical protein